MPGRITHIELAKKLRDYFKQQIEQHPERRIKGMFERGSFSNSTKDNSATFKLQLTYPDGGLENNPREKEKINAIISKAIQMYRAEHSHLIMEPHGVETKNRQATYLFTIKPKPDFKEN